MERFVNILFEFGYALIFGILGIATIFLNIPKEKGMESYKKARITFGISFFIMTLYCILRLLIPQHHGDYEDFCFMVIINFIFSWLTYSTILFLIETPRYLTRHFFTDGITPTILMAILVIIGEFTPHIRKAVEITIGGIFGIKCIWMFVVCIREYRKCINELDNYYDESPDIRWIQSLTYICLFMSMCTIAAFYVTAIHLFYYLMIPIVYSYIVLKVINFAPKKIDNIRKKNETLLQKTQEKEKIRSKETSDKIITLINAWVEKKHFCKADININDVAMEMGTNRNYLSNYLNNSLGVNFQTWLNTLRIEESKNLLVSTEKYSIEEIGIMVGIPQDYNFSRWFKKVTDMTPFQYRKLKLSGKKIVE